MRRRLGLILLALGGILISVSLTWTLQRVVGPHLGGAPAATVIRGLAPPETPAPTGPPAPGAAADRPAPGPTATTAPAPAGNATPTGAQAPTPRQSRTHGGEPEAPEASGSDD